MSLSRPARTKLVVGVALTLLFGSGVVLGLAVDHTASASPPGVPPAEEQGTTEGEGDRGMIVDAVGLTAPQKAAVDSLVAYHRGRMRDLDAEFRPRYRAVVRDLREEIKGVLTEEQRAEYETLLQAHDAKRQARRAANSRK